MKSGGQLKHFIFAALIAVIAYAACFYAIEHQRARNGPWQVTFAGGEGKPPSMNINEPRLGIANLKISFPRQTVSATNATVIFDRPREVPFELPFGQCVFMDALTQPGTVTMVMFGHEIQLVPRVLTIDKKEYPWRSDAAIEVTP